MTFCELCGLTNHEGVPNVFGYQFLCWECHDELMDEDYKKEKNDEPEFDFLDPKEN